MDKLNKKIREEQLLEGLRLSTNYEKRRVDIDSYFITMNVILNPSTPYKVCGGCAALMKRYHSDFQKRLWSELQKTSPELVPALPEFKTPRFLTEYHRNNLPTLSTADYLALESNCRNEAAKYKKKGNFLMQQDCLFDAEALKNYRLTKYNYFEEFYPNYLETLKKEEEKAQEETVEVEVKQRDRSIDKDLLIQMKEEGKTHQECADYFKVTKGAISKMLKSLNYVKTNKKKESN